MTSQVKDLTGEQFGEWKILNFSHITKYRSAVWECECSCGTTQIVPSGNLVHGRSTRCRKCADQTKTMSEEERKTKKEERKPKRAAAEVVRYYANKEEIRRKANERYANLSDKDRERLLTKQREHYTNMSDEDKEMRRAQTKGYRKNNRDKCNARSAMYNAAKLQRIPKWLTEADLEKMRRSYRLAKIMTNLKGVLYHVDHIVPLRGDSVSGLHVPENLQVILAIDNMRKGNKF